jgi:hypothetical protein
MKNCSLFKQERDYNYPKSKNVVFFDRGREKLVNDDYLKEKRKVSVKNLPKGVGTGKGFKQETTKKSRREAKANLKQWY